MICGVDQLISEFSTRNIACVRVFILLESGEYFIHNVPYIFCSGTSINPKIPEDIRWLVRNIASYNFVSSSDQAFAHSERAFALSLLSMPNFRSMYKNVAGWVIQVHNFSQEMCPACKSFFKSESPYFIDVNGTGYFVGKDYLDAYEKALDEWNAFLDANAGRCKVRDLYHDYLRGTEDNEENKTEFFKIMEPHNFNDIIRGLEEPPIILFSHASTNYEECLVFSFNG